MIIKGNTVGHPLPDPRKGLTMQGAINMNGKALTGLKAPSADTDAATKKYVDDKVINRVNLADDARYSPIISVRSQDTPTYAITAADGGITIRENNSGSDGLQVIISEANSVGIPISTEIAFLNFAKNSRTQLKFNGTRAAIAGEGILGGIDETVTVQIAEYMDMVAVKKLATDAASGDVWLVTGNVEVV